VSATGLSVDLARELRAICGDEHVLDVDERRANIIARPGSADEVAAILRLANARGFTVAPFGGQASVAWPSGVADVVLQTGRLTEVEHYDPADLTVGVGAGTTVTQLNELVGGGKLMFACDPPLPERTTVGGVLAAAKHGPMRQGFGAVRDYCIGTRFITGDGRKAKAGGHVVKNVAGYDMMKLLIGSYGTLAVITSASFKLFPAPRQTRTFLAEFATWQEALKFRDLVVRSPLAPMCLEIVSPRARKMMRPEMTDDAWIICIRGAGSDTVLARYRKELGSAVTREVDGASEIELWRALENFPSMPGTDSGNEQPSIPTFSISVPPSELRNTLAAVEDFASEGLTSLPMIGRVGLGHLLVAALPNRESSIEAVMAAIGTLELHLLRAAASGCVSKSPATQLCLPTMSSRIGSGQSMRAVKQALDPNNVLRGRETF
jgi:glycolate oxidase FAD binding subunit